MNLSLRTLSHPRITSGLLSIIVAIIAMSIYSPAAQAAPPSLGWKASTDGFAGHTYCTNYPRVTGYGTLCSALQDRGYGGWTRTGEFSYGLNQFIPQPLQAGSWAGTYIGSRSADVGGSAATYVNYGACKNTGYGRFCMARQFSGGWHRWGSYNTSTALVYVNNMAYA